MAATRPNSTDASTSTAALDEARQKQTALRRALLVWFRRAARDLPWRRTRDPYRIWLSEIMLQQTRVETVVPYYERFTQAFPRVEDLAAAALDRVLKRWEGLGYYSRARNLHQAAKRIVSDHGGRFPRTTEALQALPGIGRYTAGAIASIAFGEQTPVLDGNVRRVLARLFDIETCIDEPATLRTLRSVAETLVPPGAPGNFNQSLMELGACLCTPKRPTCGRCPVQKHCAARALGRAEKLPRRRPKKKVPHYAIVAGALRKNGRYLLGRRPPKGLLGGLWEFPGGKVESGETHEEALRRELREELGIDARVGALLATVEHAYTHFKITLNVYACEHVSGRPQANFHTALKWVPRAHFDRYAFPAANLKFLDRL